MIPASTVWQAVELIKSRRVPPSLLVGILAVAFLVHFLICMNH